jgi:BirA family biotin operon repressor/biotin-[acetyl-CoA-carboxylase] ligase
MIPAPEVCSGRHDALTADVMTPLLTGSLFTPAHYRFLPRTASTNDDAVACARDGAAEGTVIVAGEQYAGRGRLGRSWCSPPGLNLAFSMLLRPPVPPHRAAQLTLLTGVVLADTVVALGLEPERVALKWPNDLHVDGRKLAGILSEMGTRTVTGTRESQVGFVVIGIGINVNQDTGVGGDSVLPEHSVSLARALGRPVDRATLLADLLARFTRGYRTFVQDGFASVRQQWLSRAAGMGRRVQVGTGMDGNTGDAFSGVLVGLDDDGFLLVQQDAGDIRRVLAGDVTPE